MGKIGKNWGKNWGKKKGMGIPNGNGNSRGGHSPAPHLWRVGGGGVFQGSGKRTEKSPWGVPKSQTLPSHPRIRRRFPKNPLEMGISSTNPSVFPRDFPDFRGFRRNLGAAGMGSPRSGPPGPLGLAPWGYPKFSQKKRQIPKSSLIPKGPDSKNKDFSPNPSIFHGFSHGFSTDSAGIRELPGQNPSLQFP